MIRITFILLLLSANLSAQTEVVNLLTFDEFMGRVKEHHPLAIQADLKLDKGAAKLRKERGNFDPKVFSDVSQKYFSDKQYYSVINSGLKIPTWYGIEFKGGYTENDGVFLNPQNNTPGAGLWYAGVSVPVGQGLFIDKRRAALKKAQIYKESTSAERDVLYNELLYSAGKAYWNWFKSYNATIVYENALEVGNQRFEAVKQGVLFGDKPAIDTVEASIQVQNRMLQLQETKLKYKNATAMLSVYLWQDGIVPLEISGLTRPQKSDELSTVSANQELKNALDSLTNQHPLLQQYQYKVNQLKIDKKWKQEQIKPQLNLKYNAINKPVGNDAFANYNVNNYTWGVEFSMPIFLRKERGDLELAKLKINDAELELVAKQAAINYKAIAALNSLETTQEQITLYARTVKDYEQLLTGEKRMFNAGESSLFMVNSRESGYIKTQLKYIELLTKNHKASL
ncbi:MAG: TolC family protein, partial [Vicingaceae bacterium]